MSWQQGEEAAAVVVVCLSRVLIPKVILILPGDPQLWKLTFWRGPQLSRVIFCSEREAISDVHSCIFNLLKTKRGLQKQNSFRIHISFV